MGVEVAAVDDDAYGGDGNGKCSQPAQQRQRLRAEDAVFAAAVVLGVEVMMRDGGRHGGVVNGQIRRLGHCAIVDPRSVDKHDRREASSPV